MSQDDPIGTHDDPKNMDTPEERASENASRRRFLKGSAAAALGALAAAVVAKAAEADVFNPDGTRVAHVSYHPNDTLANAILKAWRDQPYRDALIGDPIKTLAAEKPPFIFAPGVIVKVLTEDEYNAGYVRSPNQFIFVLPNPPTPPPPAGIDLAQAKLAMSVTPFGM